MKLTIERGLLPHMVLQRDGKVAQKAKVLGTCVGTGAVFATAFADKVPVRGWRDRKVGSSDGRRFEATLAGLPVGGPYEIELRCGEASVTVKDVLVGDVWILAGQSNMQGCGHFPAKPLGKEPMVRAFYMDDHWAVAVDPIHQLAIAVDPVHNGGVRVPVPKKGVWRGVGPGVSYGQAMRRRTGVPQGLIACAHGGTTTAQWDPRLKKLGGGSLYGATMRRLAKNYPGGTVAGLLWYQGCSDTNENVIDKYRDATKALFKAFRKDLRSPDLPIVLVQIGNVISDGNISFEQRWSRIREEERIIGETVPNAATVPVIDLELDEGIHLSGPAQYTLGRRMADAMESIRLAGRKNAPTRPISLHSIEVGTYEDGRAVIIATFDDVVGKLVSDGRATGFGVETAPGQVGSVTNVHLEGNKAMALTTLRPNMLKVGQSAFWYGFGCNPYCNIHDEAGRSLPAFGPRYFGNPYRTTSDFMSFDTCRVSELFPTARDLSECPCPDVSKLSWMPRENLVADGTFCDLHTLFGQRHGKDEALYFVTRIHCDADWKLNLLFGYDGPCRGRMDGEEVFYDPHGTNPGLPDRVSVPVKASRGDHEIVIALSTNDGNAWGVFFRAERLSVPRREAADGKQPALPSYV